MFSQKATAILRVVSCQTSFPVTPLRFPQLSVWHKAVHSSVPSNTTKRKPETEGRHDSASLTNTKDPESGQVFNHERHNMYVCWHPEVPFPYEMSKPIDMNAPVTDSHLKIQTLPPVQEAFRQKYFKHTIRELVKLTYSTKHRFFGRYGKRKRLVYREMDTTKERRNREYL